MPTYLEQEIANYEMEVSESVALNKEFELLKNVYNKYYEHYDERKFYKTVDYVLDSYNSLYKHTGINNAKFMSLMNGIEFIILSKYNQSKITTGDN